MEDSVQHHFLQESDLWFLDPDIDLDAYEDPWTYRPESYNLTSSMADLTIEGEASAWIGRNLLAQSYSKPTLSEHLEPPRNQSTAFGVIHDYNDQNSQPYPTPDYGDQAHGKYTSQRAALYSFNLTSE